MAHNQIAPVLRLDGELPTPRLVEREPPSSRSRLLLGLLLYAGPPVVVGYWVWSFLGEPILPGPLHFLPTLLTPFVGIGWYAMLSGDRHLRKLEIDAALRVKTSALAGLHPRETSIDKARITGLRLENLLAEGGGSAVKKQDEPGVRAHYAVQGPAEVLHLTVATDEGEPRKYVFRTREVETTEGVEKLFSKISEALGFRQTRTEWSDSRKVVLAAGELEPVRGERQGAGSARPGATAASADVTLLTARDNNGSYRSYRVVEWDPPRVLIRRRWGKTWRLWAIVGSLLVAGWFFVGPYVQWFLEDVHSTSPARDLEQVAVGTWVESRGIEITLKVIFALMLVQLWRDRPGRTEIDLEAGVARATGRLTNRVISLSSVQAVRLKERSEETNPHRHKGPFVFTLDLVPRPEVKVNAFPLVELSTMSKRDRIYRELAPMARDLAEAIAVPCWNENPDGSTTTLS